MTTFERANLDRLNYATRTEVTYHRGGGEWSVDLFRKPQEIPTAELGDILENAPHEWIKAEVSIRTMKKFTAADEEVRWLPEKGEKPTTYRVFVGVKRHDPDFPDVVRVRTRKGTWTLAAGDIVIDRTDRLP